MIFGFVVLLSSLARVAGRTNVCVLNNEPYMVRPNIIDMTSVELKYYPFKTSLNNCTGSCNVLSSKMCVPNETKNINVKAFILITNKDEAKAMIKHVIQNKNGIIKHVNVNAKIITKCEKSYCWNPNPCICKNSKYLKSVADTSVTECDFSINVMSKYVDTLIH